MVSIFLNVLFTDILVLTICSKIRIDLFTKVILRIIYLRICPFINEKSKVFSNIKNNIEINCLQIFYISQ